MKYTVVGLIVALDFYSAHKSEVAWNQLISPFKVTGAHAHWVGSTNTPSHATKELKMR